jgi:hypothetical protein
MEKLVNCFWIIITEVLNYYWAQNIIFDFYLNLIFAD